MQRPDANGPVTVLGAGIVGLCTALALLERGIKVRVIERGAPGQETSYGNAGVISPWSIIPQISPGLWKNIPKLMVGPTRPLAVHWSSWPAMVPWGLRFLSLGTEAQVREISSGMFTLCGPSVDMYRKLLQGTGYEGLMQNSMYVHAFRDGSRANLNGLDNQLRAAAGANVELVGADVLHSIEPDLSPEFQAAVLIHDQARALAPGQIATVLADKAKSLGAEFVSDEIRTLKRTDTAWEIACAENTYRSEKVALCMGVWSKPLLEQLGISIPLMAERGYHVQFPESGLQVQNSVLDVDCKVVASQMAGGLRVAGQAEFGPIGAPPNPRTLERMERIARKMFPTLPPGEPDTWMGHRPSFPDSLPVLGEMPGQDGLFLNFGHSHYGLMMAPKSGELTARSILNEGTNEDLSAFDISRF